MAFPLSPAYCCFHTHEATTTNKSTAAVLAYIALLCLALLAPTRPLSSPHLSSLSLSQREKKRGKWPG